MEHGTHTHGSPREFVTTHWSVVVQAADPGSPRSAAALERLCREYWFPLYAFVRRTGLGSEDSADLTQEFFSRLLSGGGLASVSPDKGRFRSFLIASIKNLLANERDRARCLKRGGGVRVFSIDEAAAEGRYIAEGLDHCGPDRLFDRSWAELVVARSLAQLRRDCDGGEAVRRFDELRTFLLGERTEDTVAAAALRLGISLSAAKGLIHRLRRRFAELVRNEVAQTLRSPTASEIDREVRELFAAFE